jgi:hypothetical protein
MTKATLSLAALFALSTLLSAQSLNFKSKAPAVGSALYEATRSASRSSTEISMDGESQGGATSASTWTMRGYTALAIDGERITKMRVQYRRFERESKSDMEGLTRGAGRRGRRQPAGEDAPVAPTELVGQSYEIDLSGDSPKVTLVGGGEVEGSVAATVLRLEAPRGNFAAWESSTLTALAGKSLAIGESIALEGEAARRVIGLRARRGGGGRGGRQGGGGQGGGAARPAPQTVARLTLVEKIEVLGRSAGRFELEVTITPAPRGNGQGGGRGGRGGTREPTVYRGEIIVGTDGLGLHRLRIVTSSEMDRTRERGETSIRIRRSSRSSRDTMFIFADGKPAIPRA